MNQRIQNLVDRIPNHPSAAAIKIAMTDALSGMPTFAIRSASSAFVIAACVCRNPTHAARFWGAMSGSTFSHVSRVLSELSIAISLPAQMIAGGAALLGEAGGVATWRAPGGMRPAGLEPALIEIKSLAVYQLT